MDEAKTVWVLVALSCRECCRMSIMVLGRKPNDEDFKAVKEDAGGMYCISTYCSENEVGKPIEVVLD